MLCRDVKKKNVAMKSTRKKTPSMEDLSSTEEKVRVKLARIYGVPALDFA